MSSSVSSQSAPKGPWWTSLNVSLPHFLGGFIVVAGSIHLVSYAIRSHRKKPIVAELLSEVKSLRHELREVKRSVDTRIAEHHHHHHPPSHKQTVHVADEPLPNTPPPTESTGSSIPPEMAAYVITETQKAEMIGYLDATIEHWTLVVEKPDFYAVYSKKVANADVIWVKCEIFWRDIPASVVFELLHNLEERRKWDKMWLELNRIETIDEHNDILYQAIACPYPLANRDSVQARCSVKAHSSPDLFYLFFKCIQYPRCPERPGYVRSDGFSLYRMQDVAGGCKFTSLVQTDPKGNIPKFIINSTTPRMAERWIKRMTAVAEQRVRDLGIHPVPPCTV